LPGTATKRGSYPASRRAERWKEEVKKKKEVRSEERKKKKRKKKKRDPGNALRAGG
jgi:hypothetical protein